MLEHVGVDSATNQLRSQTARPLLSLAEGVGRRGPTQLAGVGEVEAREGKNFVQAMSIALVLIVPTHEADRVKHDLNEARDVVPAAVA